MKRKVWLFSIFISALLCAPCMLCTSCVPQEEALEPVSTLPPGQDTLEMKPDFSYVVTPQLPYILVDTNGYKCMDKKVAYFYGNDLKETFEIRDANTDVTVYSGTLSVAKETEGRQLYTGVFTDYKEKGNYYVYQEQVGDSYEFEIDDNIYNRQYKELERALSDAEYENVNDYAYFLANAMFIREMYPEAEINEANIHAGMEILLNSQNGESGAFFSEVLKEPVDMSTYNGTISLSTTAQMAGVLAQYAYLYQGADDPAFANQCLLAAQKAYAYVETYRHNTDTDAWYFAAVHLYRATKQYKYRNAIAEYDTLDSMSRSSTPQGYTILADITYLSTPYGTDYERCSTILDGYMDIAQNISTNSSRDSFYVLKNMDAMSEREILDDLFILGVVNHVLSGQEYAGVQKNYTHYLFGVNAERKILMSGMLYGEEGSDRINTVNASKMLVVYANL